MKRLAQLWFSITMLAQAAHAAEVELTIALPEPEWLLPPMSPLQLQPEGVPALGEEQLILELAPLISAGDYEAVLARVGMSLGPELALLEAGDRVGFLQTRTPTDGRQQLRPSLQQRPQERPVDSGAPAATRDIRPPADESRLAQRRDAGLPPDLISASMLYIIGHSYFSLQRYLPAEIAFELALTALPNHVRAHESLGMLYLRTERYADARAHLARAVELGRNTAHVHAALGYLDQKTHRYWAAANAFQRALSLEPDHRSAKRGLLHALTETREQAKAKALVEQLLRDEPDDPDLWLYRTQIALSANEPALALASLETALRLGDDSVANRHACVALHIESGNVARAVELLQVSSARGLEFSLVDQVLGWLANENEWDDFRELLASIDRASLGGVEQSRLLTRRASLALRDGNRRTASTALQEALALDPSNADALMMQGQIYREERDYGRADLLFQRASAYNAVRENALVARANVAIDQGNFDSALALLRGGVAANPARADLKRNIAVLENLVLLRTQR
jgi:tetratricopeptide (TPR) repeat protein